MDQDKQLEQKFAELQKVAAENKNVDVTALMLHSLEQTNQHLLPHTQKRWAYAISLGLPPLGLLFALKFYFGSEDDGKQTAYMCVLLTIASVILAYMMISSVFSTAGVSPQQILEIKPQDIQQLYQ